jgi:GAF domain-containing protein
VDKENEDVRECADQPISNSYRTYIHRSGEGFSVDDASRDTRVADHPKRHSYHCYYGIPLIATDGKMLGTVCHFDVILQSVTEDAATALDDLGPLIAEAAFGKN